MNEWISFKDKLSENDQSIAAIRISYPAACWVANWHSGDENDEEPLEYWVPVPKLDPEYLWVQEGREDG